MDKFNFVEICFPQMISGGMYDNHHHYDSDADRADEGVEEGEGGDDGDGGAEIDDCNEKGHNVMEDNVMEDNVMEDNDNRWKGKSNNASHTHVIHAFLG
jgi:hypothetical protein